MALGYTVHDDVERSTRAVVDLDDPVPEVVRLVPHDDVVRVLRGAR